MLCFTMASPVAWEHHYGIALPAYIIAAADHQRRKIVQEGLPVMLVSSWILVGSNLQVLNGASNTYLNPVQSYTLAGGILLLICLWNRSRLKQAP
jgi:hypothetical protein